MCPRSWPGVAGSCSSCQPVSAEPGRIADRTRSDLQSLSVYLSIGLVYIIAGITCGAREGDRVREELVPKELVSEEQAWRRPRLRAVEVLATVVEGRQMYCLRDPGEPDGAAVLVSREALLLLGLMDGERDLDGLRAAFTLRTGMQLLASQVEEL